jgi:hypothetical protein
MDGGLASMALKKGVEFTRSTGNNAPGNWQNTPSSVLPLIPGNSLTLSKSFPSLYGTGIYTPQNHVKHSRYATEFTDEWLNIRDRKRVTNHSHYTNALSAGTKTPPNTVRDVQIALWCDFR